MPRKKSIKLSAREFIEAANNIEAFAEKTSGLKDEYHTWCVDYSVIRLYREFETLMLDALAGAVNNDAKTISGTAGFDFPRHMSLPVCKYLVVGTGYFDFKGRDGLIKLVRKFVPDSHYLFVVLKDAKYKNALEQLSALRNLAAHDSPKARATAVEAIGGERLGTSGSWLKRQGRFKTLCETLRSLARDLEQKAPY